MTLMRTAYAQPSRLDAFQQEHLWQWAIRNLSQVTRGADVDRIESYLWSLDADEFSAAMNDDWPTTLRHAQAPTDAGWPEGVSDCY